MKVTLYTFGCKQNYAETSSLARQFEERGYTIVPFGSPADIVVINTCTVTETADRECRKIIRRARSVSPEAQIIVTGCYAQLEPYEISAIEGVSIVAGNIEKHKLPELLASIEDTHKHIFVTDELRAHNIEFSPAMFSENDSHTRAFLKLQDGCNYTCSFCTIPYARGRSRSMPFDQIPDHVKRLVEAGYSEIVLTGINLGEYYAPTGERLLDVMKLLVQLELPCRYRLSSIEPNRLNREIIHFVAEHLQICPHFHMPLQSGSPEILRAMRRRYKRELFAERVMLIKRLMPHACIGVDVLTGFPGEQSKHFEETYQFLEQLPVSYLHVFTYSQRPRTEAACLHDQVPYRLRKERTSVLRALGQSKRIEFYRENLGRECSVLVEDYDSAIGGYVGYSENYLRVVVAKATPRRIVRVRPTRMIGDLLLTENNERGTILQPCYVALPVL